MYEYTGGKEDWLAAGLEVEGHESGRPALAELARADVATCSVHDRAGDVLGGIGELGFALAVGDHDVVLGRLRRRHAEQQPDARVDEVMSEGPTTVRADEDPSQLLERMQAAETRSVVVTTAEGRLVGVAIADDLEAATAQHAHHH